MKQTTATFELSADTRTLASLLAEAAVGEVVTFERMTKALARDVQKDARGALQSARMLVRKEHSIVFDSVRAIGLKRLNDAEIIDLQDRTRAHIRRTARNTVKSMVCVKYDALQREEQVKHNTAISMLGIISEIVTEKSTNRLQSQVRAAGTELPAAKAAIAALGFTA